MYIYLASVLDSVEDFIDVLQIHQIKRLQISSD